MLPAISQFEKSTGKDFGLTKELSRLNDAATGNKMTGGSSTESHRQRDWRADELIKNRKKNPSVKEVKMLRQHLAPFQKHEDGTNGIALKEMLFGRGASDEKAMEVAAQMRGEEVVRAGLVEDAAEAF